MQQTWDRPEFIDALTLRFPEVTSEIMDISDGLLHCEMADFARCSHTAILEGNFSVAKAHIDFIHEALLKASPALQNAIIVSYLENVFLGETAPNFLQTRTALPPAVGHELLLLEQHWQSMSKGPSV
jgi:hypothetical protein